MFCGKKVPNAGIDGIFQDKKRLCHTASRFFGPQSIDK